MESKWNESSLISKLVSPAFNVASGSKSSNPRDIQSFVGVSGVEGAMELAAEEEDNVAVGVDEDEEAPSLFDGEDLLVEKTRFKPTNESRLRVEDFVVGVGEAERGGWSPFTLGGRSRVSSEVRGMYTELREGAL